MPAITPTVLNLIGDNVVTEITLGANGTNPLTYKPGTGQMLRLRNATAGALVPVIIGSASVAQTVPRVGVVNFAAGWTVPSMAAGAVREIPLDSIADYIQGTVNVNTAVGIVATLIERP